MAGHFLTDPVQQWGLQDTRSRFLIVICLLMLVFSYLPTLQFDYVTQDQWRAFRYSTLEQPAYDRAKSCVKMISPFYASTGRPLVWITECIGHAFVSRISDFVHLRPLVLSIVLITALYLGSVLAPLLDGLVMGVLAASIFLLAPGYSFMYFQSMPAAMVLISIILSAASFSYWSQWLDKIGNIHRARIRGLIPPLLLFISSCMIYPAWAFSVVSLAWLAFGLDRARSEWAKVWRLGSTLSFYLGGALLYYIAAKGLAALELLWTGLNQDLGSYAVQMQLSPSVLWQRATAAVRYFYAMPPLNFDAASGILVGILVLFSAKAGWQIRGRATNLVLIALYGCAVFVAGSIVLLFSISPWLFSHVPGIVPRYLIPWYLFGSAAIVGISADLIPRKFREYVPAIALFLFLAPVAAVQNRLSFFEVTASGLEIQSMRSRLHEWLDQDQLNPYLLVVRPVRKRPEVLEQLLGAGRGAEGNAILSTSANPVQIPWMINALLRERATDWSAKDVDFVYCSFDQSCAASYLSAGRTVVATTYGDVTIRGAKDPFVINLSLLTSNPVLPRIEEFQWPEIKASSQLGSYGPFGLLSLAQPGWHAQRNPNYPQRLVIDFHERRAFEKVGLLPQDGHSSRAPENIRIRVSNDGQSWMGAGSSKDACQPNAPGRWHDVALLEPVHVRFLQIEIFANCGDPNLLTLRGLRIQ